MIIKRWNGSAFVKEFPETKAQLIRNNGDTDSIFDANDKIKETYLPDSVFDSLYFFSVVATSTTLGAMSQFVFEEFSQGYGRSKLGVYYVASSPVTITPTGSRSNLNSGVLIGGEYWISTFRPSEEGSGTETPIVMETGDWIILTSFSGSGVVGNPYMIEWAVVNNTYENASTSVDGIVRLSSRTTYASLSGNNVVGESTLKTVIDNAGFAANGHSHGNITNVGAIGSTANLPLITTTSGVLTTGTFGTTANTFTQGNDARLSDARTPTSHVHGNISNAGAIGTTANLPIITTTSGVLVAGSFGSTANTFTQGNDSRLSDARTPTSHVHGDITNAGAITSAFITPATGDAIILSDTSGSDALKRGISIGTSTTTFLRNDGTWVTPVDTNTTYNIATSTTAGLVEVFSDTDQSVAANAVTTTAGRTYGIQLNAANQAVVNVPWTDTNTVATATALGGLSVSSNSFQMVHPFFVQADAPATPLTGTIWFDI